jgi:hypothetical protein
MLKQDDLDQFTGTEAYYGLGPLFPHVVLTDGTKHVADQGGAWWLMEAIASYQTRALWAADPRLKALQFWKLKVNPDRSATLTCIADSGEPPRVTQDIPYTDFPLPDIDIWVGRTGPYLVLYLPSEH